ncbi:g6893 [Coccomyxa viridis]|uniref:G6893 protein n=1 Tax=Coccomyxa viridis TaxID=1274662 RepID=A0ABP1FYY6_9CHLO
MLLLNLSADVHHVVECVTDGQSASALAVLWRVRGGQSNLLRAKGITFMKVNGQNQICYIRDAPEHSIKALLQTAPVANLATSMLASAPAFLNPWAGGSMGQSQTEPSALNAQSAGRDLNQWGSTTVSSQSPQDVPGSVPQLQAELKRARGERDALEARLKLLLQTRRAAGDSTAAVEASAAAAQLQSTATAPDRRPQVSLQASQQTYSSMSSQPSFASTGVWIKDTNRSDAAAYGRALDLMQLNGLQKTTALRLIEGVEIQQDASNFSVNFLTVVPFFKVTEQYSFSRQTSMARRDLRSGQQTAQARLDAEGVRLSITWGEPSAARVVDLYRLQAPDVLEVVSEVSVGGRTEITTQIYRRQDRWRPRFTWSGGLFG